MNPKTLDFPARSEFLVVTGSYRGQSPSAGGHNQSALIIGLLNLVVGLRMRGRISMAYDRASSGAADRWIDFRKAIQYLNCDILTESTSDAQTLSSMIDSVELAE